MPFSRSPMRQLKMSLNGRNHGGLREGSGRRRIHSKGVAHRVREKVNKSSPLHINFKFKTYIRNKTCLRILKRAIVNARSYGLRIVHFSMQSNHIHFIIEADNNEILTKGMRSLTITFAKGLNQGKIQVERYHLHVLKTLRETKNAINYVLFNKQKHEKGTCSEIDNYCSLFGLNKMIKAFAKKNKITIKMGTLEQHPLDKPVSYFLKTSLRP
jgi:REP element-mobilizing transposase RayT